MEKYLRQHLNLTEKVLSDGQTDELKNWLVYNRVQISFLQHERLAHLLVTLFIALFLLIIFLAGLFYASGYFILMEILLAVLLIFYLKHYYILENGVQRLYRLDRELEKRCSGLFNS